MSTLSRAAIVAIFFASGAAGLIYEVLWTRQLSLIFGATTYAVSTVLATYMAGLALGSYVFGRWIDRRSDPLRVYAVLEGAIGLYALLVPTLFEALRGPYVFLRQLDLSFTSLVLARSFLAALVLLPPTILMGGTFPALARFWVRTREEVGRGAGLLYFINTGGAVAGCLLGGFVLIEQLGLRGSAYFGVGINFTAALIAGVLARIVGPGGAPQLSEPATVESESISANQTRLVLFCIGLSGFTSLAYEVLWSRALLRYVYNSSYAFTTMLATFLFGIALGSAIFTWRLRRSRSPLVLFAVLQILVAIGFVVSSRLFVDLTGLTTQVLGAEFVGSFRESLLKMFLGSAFVLLPPTIFLGASLPLATEICARGLRNLGAMVGRVYAVNTLGAILGSLGAGFVLIPSIGMQGTLTLLIVLNVASAGALVLAALGGARRLVAIGAVGAIFASIPLLVPPDLFIATFAPPGQKLVYYREGATDTVGVVEVLGTQRAILYEDRRGTAGTNSYANNFFFGHLPMLIYPGVAKKILHICFGVGNSLSAVGAHEGVERIDSVELSPHVVEAAEFFWTNNDVIHHPKVRHIFDDGRNFVMATREQYDVIMLEPPETFTAGVIHLYTREFYEEAIERLAPGGIMMQWIPTGEAPLDQERMLFRAFADVFPYVSAWRQLNSGCILLIGSREPQHLDYKQVRAKMREPRVQRDMELSQIRNVDHLLTHFILDDAGFREFVHDVGPVTDDRTVLDFSIPRYLGSGFGLGSWNTDVREEGHTPWKITFERSRFYADQRRSISPLLTNFEPDSREAIAARIEVEARKPFPKPAWITQENWRRW